MEQKYPGVAGIPWDQPATMIDLDGKPPLIGTIRDCAVHFGLYKDLSLIHISEPTRH